jgi:hypothetical protein
VATLSSGGIIMPIYAGRRFHAVALALIIGAIATDFLGKYHVGRGIMASARSATGQPAVRLQLKHVVSWHLQRSQRWGALSLGLAAVSVGCWLFSLSRRETGGRGVLLTLFAFYVFLLFLLV